MKKKLNDKFEIYLNIMNNENIDILNYINIKI